ncbi:MAG: 4-hydroxybutyryl-CoA dehydratase [Deltaproteobacteria bacterium]|nr:4-hydroxybutyryl-CoA dehydratase [Deltaproteobacteria bacterium]
MKTAEDYVASLRKRNLRLFVKGKRVDDPVDHPAVAPSVRTVAESYRLAHDPEHRDVFTAHSRFIDDRVNRFTHIFESQDDLRKKTEMQRVLGRTTGTCFQRCVGMDALNALFNVTFEMDEELATAYHPRFLELLRFAQREDLILCGAMTDPKGDRRKAPAEQPDQYLRVVERRAGSIVVRGAKMHQTGVANSHWILVMPGRSLADHEGDFAVSFAVPVDAKGITLVYGRQPSDDRRLGCDIDQGNARYGGQEAVVIFEDVEVPLDHVFMLGETAWANPLVEYFAGHHRASYGGCKPGNGDVLIGAAALIARLNGTERASHVRDKLVEMVHLNETMHAGGLAAGARGHRTPAGTYMVDPLLANVCKHNVTRFPYEMTRLAEDLAGGLLVSMPAAEDLEHPEYGELLKTYVTGARGTAEDRVRVLRLIENMTLGATAVAIRTESMHGAGSPQAQRVRMEAQANLDEKVANAARIAGVAPVAPTAHRPVEAAGVTRR